MIPRKSVKFIPLVSDDEVVRAFREALSLLVGQGRRYKLQKVAEGAGIHPDTIYRFKTYEPGTPEHRSLDIGQMMSLTKFLRAEFTNLWIGICDQGAFDIDDEEPSPGDMLADVAGAASDLARAQRDGSVSRLPAVGAILSKRGHQLTVLAGRAA